jgi:hypothetical protein
VASDPLRAMTGGAPHDEASDPPREIAALDPRHEMTSDQPRQAAADLLPLDRNEPVWPTVDSMPLAEDIVLPAPDVNAFAIDYRPWRTVILADGSQTATYLALGAITQWNDPPAVPVAAGRPQLPAPAIPPYFGGGETVTSIAE